jgi:hypothetical protein
MVISGRMACRLRRRIGRANRPTNHHADRTMLGPGHGVWCLFSPTSTYCKEAELILLDARQAPLSDIVRVWWSLPRATGRFVGREPWENAGPTHAEGAMPRLCCDWPPGPLAVPTSGRHFRQPGGRPGFGSAVGYALEDSNLDAVRLLALFVGHCREYSTTPCLNGTTT